MALFRISKRYVLAVRSEYRGHISGARLVISAIIWYHHHKQGTHWQCLKELGCFKVVVVVVVSGNWVCQILAGEMQDQKQLPKNLVGGMVRPIPFRHTEWFCQNVQLSALLVFKLTDRFSSILGLLATYIVLIHKLHTKHILITY